MTEVENAFVLDYLRTKTPMKKIPLSQVHRDSPDPRGIDVCLLYRTDRVKLLHSEFIPIRDKKGKIQDTREIVYACFEVNGNSNLHVFVNHWPSRRGGELETQQKRNHVASILRKKIDSLLIVNPACNIVITGDFNDDPYNQSITKVLKVREVNGEPLSSELYNLSSGFVKKYKTGTLKFRGNWSLFDQIIVSGALLNGRGLSTCSGCAGVFNKSFLLTEDKTYMGYMPWRTFNGMTYSGGFSDHLPVYLNLYFSKP
ncbi:MAG: endonuclease [Bacteroidetes bacterium]|nr:endonuclease [Bacteroidota bacterium]